MLVLGIESSCDETAAAVVDGDGRVLADVVRSQIAAHAPYDGILVTAGAPSVPAMLVDQLVDGGRLLIPVGKEREQTLVRVERRGSRTIEKTMLGCRFVKLIGQDGWQAD